MRGRWLRRKARWVGVRPLKVIVPQTLWDLGLEGHLAGWREVGYVVQGAPEGGPCPALC
jgi:hypothetical protein